MKKLLMEKLEQFKYYLIRQGKRASTVDKHITGLTYLYTTLKSLDVKEIERYIFALYQQGRSAGHLNNLIASTRLYGEFLHTDIYKRIKYFKIHETVKGTLSDEEIEKFLAIKSTEIKRVNPETFEMFTRLFAILAFSGLRPAEATTMRLQQIDFGTQVFRLDHTTKTATPRTVPINPLIVPVLKTQMATRTDSNLFPPINRHQWKDQFNMRIKLLQIKRDKISTYSLRHSFAVRILDNNNSSLFTLKRILGHKRLEMTEKYFHLTTKSLVDVVKNDPLSKKHLTKTEKIMRGRKALEDLGFTVLESQEVDNKIRYTVVDE